MCQLYFKFYGILFLVNNNFCTMNHNFTTIQTHSFNYKAIFLKI